MGQDHSNRSLNAVSDGLQPTGQDASKGAGGHVWTELLHSCRSLSHDSGSLIDVERGLVQWRVELDQAKVRCVMKLKYAEIMRC